MFDDDTIEIMPRPIAAVFWLVYLVWLGALVYLFGIIGGHSGPALGFAVLVWALSLPGYVILFSTAYEKVRRK